MIPPAVLAAYPPEVRECTWTLLPSGGGMSGGRVWRGDGRVGAKFALKRWQASVTPERLRVVHERMQQVEEVGFVAKLLRTHSNITFAVHAGCCWDVTEWQPGMPDLLHRASLPQLIAAGSALATL